MGKFFAEKPRKVQKAEKENENENEHEN